MNNIIELPSGVNATIEGTKITITGPKGADFATFNPNNVKAVISGNQLTLEGKDDGKRAKNAVNTLSAHVNNMITGVTKEFEYHMAIVYSHFPMTVTKKEKHVEVVNYLGSKQVKKAAIVGATKVEIKGKDVVLKGPSRSDVGQTAANLERIANTGGKDKRIFQDGVYITNKGN